MKARLAQEEYCGERPRFGAGDHEADLRHISRICAPTRVKAGAAMAAVSAALPGSLTSVDRLCRLVAH